MLKFPHCVLPIRMPSYVHKSKHSSFQQKSKCTAVFLYKSIVVLGYRVEMLDIQTGRWIEVTFIEGYEPKCTLSNILYGIMYRFRVIALNDAGASEPGEPSEPIVIDVPGVQIAPYFVQMLNDTIALEHEKVMI